MHFGLERGVFSMGIYGKAQSVSLLSFALKCKLDSNMATMLTY